MTPNELESIFIKADSELKEWQKSTGCKEADIGETSNKFSLDSVMASRKELFDALDYSPDRFESFVRRKLGIPDSITDELLLSLPRRITLREWFHITPELEHEIFNYWLINSDGIIIPAYLASSPSYWYCVTLRLTREGFLSKDLSELLYEKIIPKNVDEYPPVNIVFRNLGGIHSVRGNVSVKTDSPISRTYHRSRLCHKLSSHSGGKVSFAEIQQKIQRRNIYDAVAVVTLKTASVLNNPTLLLPALMSLSDEYASKWHEKTMSKYLKNIAKATIYIIPEMLDYEEIASICEESADKAESADS